MTDPRVFKVGDRVTIGPDGPRKTPWQIVRIDRATATTSYATLRSQESGRGQLVPLSRLHHWEPKARGAK